MALRNAVGGAYSAATVKNNNGTIVKGGNAASDGPVTKVLGVNDLADDRGESFGSKVVANDGTGAATTDRVGVAKALSGGTLAFNASATQWVMQGGNVTSTLSGAANDVLRGGARDFNGDINDDAAEVARVKVGDRLIGNYAAATFDVTARPSTQIVPGRSKGTGAGNAHAFQNTTDTTNAVTTEIAASRSVPGELIYQFGGATPKLDDYKAKNANE